MDEKFSLAALERCRAGNCLKHHATVARDYDTRVLPYSAAQPTASHERQQSGATEFFREKFPQELERLVTEIRVRHYSIRTEQAYVQWVARF